MSDDVLHVGPTGDSTPVPPTDNGEQASSNETAQVASGDEGAASPQLTDEQLQEQQREGERARRERARRNQQAAFDRLARERDEFKQVALELARARAGGTAPQAPGQPQQPADRPPSRDYNPATGRPFESYDEYLEARAVHAAERRAAAALEERLKGVAEQVQRAQAEQHVQAVAAQHFSRIEQFAKQQPDFDAVTDRDDVSIPDAAAAVIMQMPDSGPVLYEIGRNPAIAERLWQMPPDAQKVYIGQLSAALHLRPRQVSKAPAPGQPVSGKSNAPLTLETATSYDDFVKIRRRQIAQRRGSY